MVAVFFHCLSTKCWSPDWFNYNHSLLSLGVIEDSRKCFLGHVRPKIIYFTEGYWLSSILRMSGHRSL